MTEHTYILTIDVNGSPGDLGKIQQYVTTSKDFTSWWNHLPMVFMLESALSADTIGEKLHALTPDSRFLLTEVNLAESQGWLPEVSWKWIEKRALSTTAQQSSRF
jgi:hypothetical protein